MITSRLKEITSEELDRQIKDLLSSSKEEKIEKILPATVLTPAQPVDFSSFLSFSPSSQLSLSDLLQHHGKDFIRFAYRAILNREPDPDGLNFYLSKLKSGAYTKTDIICALRFSKEGRKHKIKIKGLFPRCVYSFLKKISFLGYIIRIVKNFFTLSKIETRLNVLENSFYPDFLSLNHTVHNIQHKLHPLEKDFLSLNHTVHNIQHILHTLEKDFLSLNHAVYNIQHKLHPLEKDFLSLNHTVHNIQQEVCSLRSELQKKRIPQVFVETPFYPQSQDFSFYTAFQKAFRGEKDVIKERLRIYLDYIPQASSYPVLELGAGRGEFLELLKEHSIPCIGVDVNEDFVNFLKSKGFQIFKEDAITFLKNTSQTFRAITAFHLVEHLPYKNVPEFIKLCYEHLEEGGVLIVEMPNPWFIYAFATFYIDPTHIKPIPPETIGFYFHRAGFKNIKFLYLQPYLSSIPQNLSEKVFYQDFAVIGEKHVSISP